MRKSCRYLWIVWWPPVTCDLFAAISPQFELLLYLFRYFFFLNWKFSFTCRCQCWFVCSYIPTIWACTSVLVLLLFHWKFLQRYPHNLSSYLCTSLLVLLLFHWKFLESTFTCSCQCWFVDSFIWAHTCTLYLFFGNHLYLSYLSILICMWLYPDNLSWVSNLYLYLSLSMHKYATRPCTWSCTKFSCSTSCSW